MPDVTSAYLLLSAFGLLVVGALVGLLFGKDWRKTGYVSVVFMAAAAVALWTLAARVISYGSITTDSWLTLVPLGASLTFRVDNLSAVFLLLVPFIGLAALLYSVEFMKKVHSAHSPRLFYPFALLLMASIVGVVTSYDLLYFFTFWELMTLTSWVLVLYDREDQTKARAAWQYFLVTHVAAACILAAMLVVYSHTGSFAFPDITRGVGQIAASSRGLAHLLMGLFLIGFVTKAGIYPFGGWLPQAYPAAPSPASAAFAGSMTKLGIYGVVRTAFEFFQAPGMSTTWGAVIAVVGTLSIFVGMLAALKQDDAKRLLSFSITGQMGYIMLAVGTSLFFLRSNPVLASLGLIAGLYHIMNDACSKALLFLNVGSAEYYTRTRDLNKMGGLGTAMPFTLATTIIATLAIAGVPPLNGFVSKWLIYQSTIRGGLASPIFLLFGAVAVFISLVTLASFMKLVGSIFLGKRAKGLEDVNSDVPAVMRIPQVALSAVCVILGIVPILPLMLLYGAANDVLGAATVPAYGSLFGGSSYSVVLSAHGSAVGVWNPVYIVVALVVLGSAACVFSRLGRATSREAESWLGGEESLPDEVRYRAHGFVLPFKTVFAGIYPAISIPKIEALKSVRKLLDFDRWLYNPLVKAGGSLTDRLSRTHSGVPQLYMLWQLVGVIVVLAVLLSIVKQ